MDTQEELSPIASSGGLHSAAGGGAEGGNGQQITNKGRKQALIVPRYDVVSASSEKGAALFGGEPGQSRIRRSPPAGACRWGGRGLWRAFWWRPGASERRKYARRAPRALRNQGTQCRRAVAAAVGARLVRCLTAPSYWAELQAIASC